MIPQAVKTVLRTTAGRAYAAVSRLQDDFAGKLLILMYHRVIPRSEVEKSFVQPGMYVTPETFERHLEWVTRHFQVVSLGSLLERWNRGDSNDAARLCAITFDDGWLDNYTHAYPLLRAYGVPASVFLPTDLIGTRDWLWSDRLGHLLRASTRMRKTFGDPDTFIERAKALPVAARTDLIADLAARLNVRCPDERRFLTWDEVREMASGGIDFGSHTCSHAILTRLDEQSLQRELRRPLAVLGRELARPLPVIAYPNGNHAPAVVRAARAAGYIAAMTTEPGLESHRPIDRFRLKRIGVHEDVSRSIPLLTFHLARQLAAGRRVQ